MAKPGDIVRYLNEVGGGKILRIEGNMAIVDDDGFDTPMPLRECVVVQERTANSEQRTAGSEQRTANSEEPEPEPEEIIETPEGDSLNIVLAFEPVDIKQLSKTDFDAFIVNDSNYFLYISYLTRANEAEGWTTRYAGVVEPNMQVYVGEVLRSDLTQMDHVAVQYIAFKRGREFAIKAPGAVEYKMDTTKFCKLHCFRDNIYFESQVIALDIVKDDVPVRPQALEEKLRQTEPRVKSADRPRKPLRKPVVKRKERRNGDIIEVDLHINQLLDNTRGLSAADMLNLQIDEFRRVMDANLRNHGQKIVFIHGKGEGVLRSALMKELTHRYKGHDVQDASFQQYGFGATQVTIR